MSRPQDQLYGGDPGTPMTMALSGVRPLTAPSFRPSLGLRAPTGNEPQSAVQIPGSPTVPAQQSPQDALAQWGYTGELPINNQEQQAIDFANNIYSTGGGLGTLGPAQDYYNRVLNGEFGPEGQAYLEAVLNPMKSSAMTNYNELSKALATHFSDVGAYYGGRGGIAQGKLAAQTANDMAQQEANLRYQAYMDNMGRMSGAAGGLQNLGSVQGGLSDQIMNYLLGTGSMITGRSQYNTQQYQAASDKAYQDWARARSELLAPFGWANQLATADTTAPVVTQQSSILSDLLGMVGNVGGLVGGSALTKVLGLNKP